MTGQVLDWIALAAIWSVIPAATIFIVLYAARSNWRATSEGRAIMYRTVAIDMVLIMGLIRFFVDDWAVWAMALRMLAYVAVAVAFWWMLVLLIRAQRKREPSS